MYLRRAVGFLLTRRFSPRGTPRTDPARSLHSLRDLPIGADLRGAGGVAAAALIGGGALAYFMKGPDDESAARKEEDMKAMFEDWMKKYDKAYRDEEEKAMRFQLFKAAVKRIESRPPSLREKLQISYFADFKEEEHPAFRSCVDSDDTESEVYCDDEEGELIIWTPDVKQSDMPATQVST